MLQDRKGETKNHYHKLWAGKIKTVPSKLHTVSAKQKRPLPTDLHPPNTLLRETKIIISTHAIGKGFKTKPSFGLDAPQLALVFSSHSH